MLAYPKASRVQPEWSGRNSDGRDQTSIYTMNGRQDEKSCPQSLANSDLSRHSRALVSSGIGAADPPKALQVMIMAADQPQFFSHPDASDRHRESGTLSPSRLHGLDRLAAGMVIPDS